MAASFINQEGKEINRTKCQIYTRVMWYLRPVEFYNKGKKSEFYTRKYFDGIKGSNKDFMNKYFVGAGSCPCS